MWWRLSALRISPRFAAAPICLTTAATAWGASSRCEETKRPIEIVSKSSKHVDNIKIWGTGLLKDPEGLSAADRKRGKGVQHLNSEYWVGAMGTFIGTHLPLLRAHLAHTENMSDEYQYRYFLNQSNMLFMEALKRGLRTAESREQFLMASWLAMAAAEVDQYNYRKYTSEERVEMRKRFYTMYLRGADLAAPPGAPPRPEGGPLTAPMARIDLLPPVALERLSLHNELCCLLWKGGPGDSAPNDWLTKGFKVSKRVDSLKRHMDESHHYEYQEDAIAHLIWNFMAIYHVVVVFPDLNDCPNYEALCQTPGLRT